MSPNATISVIIPTIGRKDHLKNCIIALINQKTKPDEILVIDNSCSNTIKNTIYSLAQQTTIPVEYYCEKRRGSSYGRNQGIRRAKYSLLAFLDDDCVPSKDWLYYMRKTSNKHPNTITQGRSLNGSPNTILSCVEDFFTRSVFVPALYKRKNVNYSLLLDTKNFAIPKSLINKYGIYFDNRYDKFSIYEDIDFGLQYGLRGIKLVYSAKAYAIHYGRTTLMSNIKREFEKGRAFYVHNNKWKNSVYMKMLQIHLSSQNFNKTILKIQMTQNQSIPYKLVFTSICYIFARVRKLGYLYETLITNKSS